LRRSTPEAYLIASETVLDTVPDTVERLVALWVGPPATRRGATDHVVAAAHRAATDHGWWGHRAPSAPNPPPPAAAAMVLAVRMAHRT
jgi:hypothetical protein